MSEIRVPKETVNDESVTVVLLPAAPDEAVEVGDVVAELETSKANVMLEATAPGFVVYHCSVGDELAINGLVGSIEKEPGVVRDGGSQSVEAAGAQADRKGASRSADPIFSDGARELMRSAGIEESHFADFDFVGVADVQKFIDSGVAGGGADASAKPESGGKAVAKVISPPSSGSLCGDSFSELILLIRSDLYRFWGRSGFGIFIRSYFGIPGFKVSTLARICAHTKSSSLLRFMLHPIMSLLLKWASRRYGIRLPIHARVGSGLCIGHWGGIWINPGATIGRNCNLNQEVSIGSAGKEAQVGHPVIGDNVFVGPGAKISGPIRIGRNVVIAANSLVTSDVPDNSVLVGVPAKVVATVAGDSSYISHTDYPDTGIEAEG